MPLYLFGGHSKDIKICYSKIKHQNYKKVGRGYEKRDIFVLFNCSNCIFKEC